MVSTHVWLRDAEQFRSEIAVAFPDETRPQEAVGFSTAICGKGDQRVTLHFDSVRTAERLVLEIQEGCLRYAEKLAAFEGTRRRVAGRRLTKS
jgi:hypothetical protein